jgi:hypothetical protein
VRGYQELLTVARPYIYSSLRLERMPASAALWTLTGSRPRSPEGAAGLRVKSAVAGGCGR